MTGGTGGDGGHTSTSTSSAAKPNIFFFLIDDMGWNDIGYQSTDLSAFTPNMDRLAADGVKVRVEKDTCKKTVIDGSRA